MANLPTPSCRVRNTAAALNTTLAQGAPDIAKLASVAKAKVGEAGRSVGEQAVQLHGGMGMTEELKVGHYLKRLVAINIQYGDPAFHIMRCAEDVFKSASTLEEGTTIGADRAANAA
jgi:alkylation response protein AidB-like acyl-CoA dehydrogenase